MLAMTNRRRFLATTAAAALPASGLLAAPASPSGPAPTAADLAPTAWIDATNPRIAQLAVEITQGAATPGEAAARLHDWVRDRIPFGIPPAFYALRASEVLEAGIGYCNTKTTLFSALLAHRPGPKGGYARYSRPQVANGRSSGSDDRLPALRTHSADPYPRP